MDIDDDDDDIYDDIIRHRETTRRTNWRHRSTSLSQRDVALAATIKKTLPRCKCGHALKNATLHSLSILQQQKFWLQCRL